MKRDKRKKTIEQLESQAQHMAKVVNTIVNDQHFNDFSLAELSAELKKNYCAYSQFLPAILKKKGFIVSSAYGKNNFKVNGPIHYSIFGHAIAECNNTSKDKESPKVQVIDLTSYEIDKMISTLKQQGYRVLRPKPVEYEEL